MNNQQQKHLFMRKFDLEKRLIRFSILIIEIINEINKSQTGIHLSNQLVRSDTSVSLNYGEAQGAESRKDFIHKMRIILKELRESYICLEIIKETNLCRNKLKLIKVHKECNELISIFVKSIETAKSKLHLK